MTEVFYAIAKASFQGSIVILAVLILRLLLQKAPRGLFCLLWLLAGLRLALPFEIQSPFSLQPRLEETSITVQAEKPVQNPADDYFDSQPQQNIPQLSPELPEIDWEDIPAVTYPLQHVTIPEPVSYGEIAAGIWAIGLAAMLTASALSYFRLKRRVREACLVEKGCFECPGLETAFVLGFMPPKIYLPVGLTDREKAFIYDHENTHIARHDHWFKLLGYLVLSIHWFNPLVWLGYHLLCRDMELACDEHVVRNMTLPERKAYSAALLSCGSHTARIAACPVAFGESNPKRRIMNVLNYKRPTFWISLLAVIAVIFVSVCLLTSPENKEEEPPEEELRWNLEMQVTDVTPSGATVEFIQQGDFPDRGAATLQFGTHYTLERLENGQWVEVEMLPQEYDVAWTMEAYIIEIGKTATRRENWEWLYGQLPAGHYRIGKDVDLFRTTGDWDSEMFYAEFDIAQTEPEQPAWTMDMTEEEYLAMCRNAMIELKNSENLNLEVEYQYSGKIHYFTKTKKGWMIQCYNTLWLDDPMILLRMGNEQYIYCGDHDEEGQMTLPYYWHVEQNPEKHIFRLPDAFDLDWENMELTYLGTETDAQMDMIRLTGPEDGSEYIFYFTLEGEFCVLDVSQEEYYTRICVRNFDDYSEAYLERYYEEASAEVGKKPEPLDAEYYEELFTRRADGAYAEAWVVDLFDTFYREPVEFLNQLSRIHPERTDEILELMALSAPYHAEARFQWLLVELQSKEVDQALVEKLHRYASEVPTAKCAEALKRLHAQGYWEIEEGYLYTGDEGWLTETSTCIWYISGDNLVQQNSIPEDGGHSEFWKVRYEGDYYFRKACVYDDRVEEEWNTLPSYMEGDIGSTLLLPWPLRFDWENAEITYIATSRDGWGETISFSVKGDPKLQNAAEQDYTVSFRLDNNGDLRNVELRYQIDNVYPVADFITLRSSSREAVEDMIRQCYNEAVAQTGKN